MSHKVSLCFLCFLVLFTIWECLSRLTPHLLFILPPPSEIFFTLWELKSRFFPTHLQHIKRDVSRIFLGSYDCFSPCLDDDALSKFTLFATTPFYCDSVPSYVYTCSYYGNLVWMGFYRNCDPNSFNDLFPSQL